MSKKKNKFEFESEEKRTKCLEDIIGFFHDERDEEIGFVVAEKILDFFLQTIGEDIYKKAIKDSKKLIKGRLENLDIELDMLSAE